MNLAILNQDQISAELVKVSLIAYSKEFTAFAHRAYQTKQVFVGIMDGGELKGFFPVFERTFNGQKTVEVPIFIYTDIYLVDQDYKVEGKRLGQNVLSLFNADVVRLNICPLLGNRIEWTGFKHIFTAMIATLDGVANYPAYLATVLSKNARSKIYKSESSGLTFSELSLKDFPEFYELYQQHVHSLGSKPHPRHYFQHIFDSYSLGENLFMFGLRHDDKLVAANLFVTNQDYMEVRFLADDLASRSLYANNFLYSKMLQWAFTHSIKFIDFGGIPKSMQSNIDFKVSFGAKPYPIYTKYFFRSLGEMLKFRFYRRLLYLKKYHRLMLKKIAP